MPAPPAVTGELRIEGVRSESAEEALVRSAHREAVQRVRRRASLGRVLVAIAVFAPALVVLGVYLVLQDRLYGYHVPGPKWPWIVADVALLLLGMRLMRGEDL